MGELSEGHVALSHRENLSLHLGNLNGILLTNVCLPGFVPVYLTNLQSHFCIATTLGL